MRKTMDNIYLVKEIKKLLLAEFGNEIQNVILYGSRSKGTSVPDSDYDILVILKHPYDWRMRKKISSLCYDIDLKYDILTDVKTVSEVELNKSAGKQPYLLEAIREGIAA
ncbi:MAG: nucleotidyltransferase domain-containing protein [Desulfobacterales bacterium]